MIADGVVFSYDPLALHIQDVARFARDEWVTGSVVRTIILSLYLWEEEPLGQVPTGRRQLCDLGKCQLFLQPVLQGPKGTLRPAPRRRRFRADRRSR